MNRAEMWSRVRAHPKPWDIIVVGGGATGVGVAIDAASRGYDVLLLEQSDFGKGTSSRSTKLAHGGVRYLEQGNIGLVMEALKERGLLLQNAPHIVHDLAFVVPNYDWWQAPFYGLGLKLYQLLAGKYGFGKSRLLSRDETLERLPTLKTDGLRGGAIYYDGQFDDARLLIHMVFTAFEQGATLLNYVEVTGFTKDAQDNSEGFVNGITARDIETGEELRASAKVVINATGAFSDRLRQKAQPAAVPIIKPSQGIHLVFGPEFLQADSAVLVPHTSDGRVLFAIPWHGHTLVGTTDTPVETAALEPVAMEQEIEFVLATAGQYLEKAPTREDVLSVFAGIRPLVRASGSIATAALSRDHVIHIDTSGLMTITGGKWTTYRHMAEDCVDQAATLAQLPDAPCVTEHLKIHGFHPDAKQLGHLAVYGSDAAEIQKLVKRDAKLGRKLHPALPYIGAEVIWAVRHEMALTIEDVLARRMRVLFLNAGAALQMAPTVVDLMAPELGWDATMKPKQLAEFQAIAGNYVLVG
jgi:glycerol-3-phosphate dehydrogenase